MAVVGPIGSAWTNGQGGTTVNQMPWGIVDPDARYAADTSLKTAQLPWDYKRDVFNQVFPLLRGQLDGAFGADKSQIGGLPIINRNPIWNPQQVQQQVNAGRAQNDQATQTQQRLATQGMAGRGFGANSPLAMAIQGQLAGQNMATNADTERGTRMQAAQQNAQHQLGAQTAWEAAYADRQRPWLQYFGNQQNALLSAIAGLL